MDDGFIIGVFTVIGIIFGGFAGHMIGTYNADVAIRECQKELPRNIHCKIIAVPVDKE